MTTGRVTVGLDDSAGGRAALRYGIAEAQRLATGLELVYVPRKTHTRDPVYSWGGRDPAERPLSDGFTEVRRIAPQLAVTATLAAGPAAEALVQRSADAAAVIVGAHGAPGFPALYLGATSALVAAHADGPVIVVPAGHEAPDGPVVVGVDESLNAGLALRYALRAANLRGTGLVAVHAWQPPSPHRSDRAGATFEELRTRQQQALDAVLGQWRGAFPEVPVDVRLLPGEPAATLLAAATRAGLLVIGASTAGSIARCVLERARCPVAIVHPRRPATRLAVPKGPGASCCTTGVY